MNSVKNKSMKIPKNLKNRMLILYVNNNKIAKVFSVIGESPLLQFRHWT